MQPHPTQGGGSIHRALYYWGEMPQLGLEMEALYAFRNGVVHDGSLTSKTSKGQWYIFRYDDSIPDSVRLANTPWDGTAAGMGPDTLARINTRALTDLVSKVISNIRQCHSTRPHQLGVLQSRDEILHKYCFWRRRVASTTDD